MTLSDERMIDELKRGRDALLSDTSPSALASVLRRRLQSITRNIYILGWTPEECGDLYDVLVDGVSVVHVAISRENAVEEVFEVWPVEEYVRAQRHLTKPTRRKLKLALQLAKTETPG